MARAPQDLLLERHKSYRKAHERHDSIDRARVALDAFVSGACPEEEAETGL